MSAAHMTTSEGEGRRGGGTTFRAPAGAIGLWSFIAVVTTLFFLLTIACLARSEFTDWIALGDPGQPLANPRPLWINTVLLLGGSIMMELAHRAARARRIGRMRIGLALGGLFAAAFISGQLDVWQQLQASGYLVASNPANSFFYLITGLHGLHLLGGLVFWGVITVRAWRGVAPERLQLHVALTARYWHFLLLLWLAMFGLLASSDETLAALGRLCGVR
jgi:cytochrome c oxidase subunit 3